MCYDQFGELDTQDSTRDSFNQAKANLALGKVHVVSKNSYDEQCIRQTVAGGCITMQKDAQNVMCGTFGVGLVALRMLRSLTVH